MTRTLQDSHKRWQMHVDGAQATVHRRHFGILLHAITATLAASDVRWARAEES